MVIVCASGGLDSGVLLARAAEMGVLRGALFVSYGQPAALEEWRSATAQTKKYGVKLREMHLPINAGAMLAPAGDVGPRLVIARNALFVGLAANLASEVGATRVWLGAIADDQADYFDCRPAWAVAVSEAIGCRVVLPLVALSKREVVLEAVERGVDGWSCYAPRDGSPCGGCNSCRSRAGT